MIALDIGYYMRGVAVADLIFVPTIFLGTEYSLRYAGLVWLLLFRNAVRWGDCLD